MRVPGYQRDPFGATARGPMLAGSGHSSINATIVGRGRGGRMLGGPAARQPGLPAPALGYEDR